MSIDLLERAAAALAPLALSSEVRELLDDAGFLRAIPGFLRPDAPSQARATGVVLPRLRAIARR